MLSMLPNSKENLKENMPKDRLYAREKMLVASKILAAGLDVKNNFIGDFVDDAQLFITQNSLDSSDDLLPGALNRVEQRGDKYLRVYNDGREERITKELYVNEVVYNYLPQRFKTYTP